MAISDEIQSTNFESEHHKLLINLLVTHYWLESKIQVLLKTKGLSEPQFNVLRILRGQKGRPVSLMEVQERMINKMSNTTRLVEKLRAKGLVSRTICAENRRKVEILITPQGLKLLDNIDPIMKKQRTQLMGGLSDQDAAAMNALLDKMRGNSPKMN